MKTFYKYFFITALLGARTIQSHAQQPVYLGKVNDIVNAYQAKAATAGKNNQIIHIIDSKTKLILNIKATTADSVLIFAGTVDTSKNSYFFLRIVGDSLSGYIMKKDQKIAYQYSSKSGAAYITAVDIHNIICLDYDQAPKADSLPLAGQAITAELVVPSLQSLPGAPAVVLLDFNGELVWDLNWSWSPINAAPANLTQAEMTEVWKIISEDYSPFNLNITTDESVYQRAAANRRMRVIFTPTNYFASGGGVAYVGSWGGGSPCWVFNSGIKGAGDAGSHEVGHTLGLHHDGRTSPHEEYYHGQENWAPIMGSSYTRYQAQWSKGEYAGANNTEDDLAKLSNPGHGFTYRVDDHLNSGSSTPIITDASGNIPPNFYKGVIETTADVDVFSFTTTGGPVSININTAPYANLDVLLTLKNAFDVTLLTLDPTTDGASLNLPFLAKGTYHLYVGGTRGAMGANSDYGSLGQYSISGKIVSNGIYVLNTASQTTCNGTFYDPGYNGDYSNNQNIVETFTPGTAGNLLKFNFTSFNLENGKDFLYVYDGATTSAPLIGRYTGTAGPGIFNATNPGGQITFRFTSDAATASTGWQASVSCITSLAVQWDRRFGASGNENLTTVIKTSDGGYLLGGYSSSAAGGDISEPNRGTTGTDYWILKLTANLTPQWNKRFGGMGNDILNSMVQTPDGGYLLGGTSASGIGGDKSYALKGNNDYWIVKISATGIKQWDRSFGGLRGNNDLRNVINTADGGFLLTGFVAGSGGGDITGLSKGSVDYWVVKISSAGGKQWDKLYGGALGDEAQAAVQAPDGGYLIAGNSNSPASGDKSQDKWGNSVFNGDYWIIKITPGGIKQWDKRFGGFGDEKLTSVILTDDGGYLLGGSSKSGHGGDKSVDNNGSEDPITGYPQDYWIVKTTADGVKQWDKTYGGTNEDNAASLIKTADGGYLIAGTSLSGRDGDKTEATRGLADYWMVKVNTLGQKQWDKRFGGTSTDELRGVVQATDNGYLLAGSSVSGIGGDKTEASRGALDYWIVKTTPAITSQSVVTLPHTELMRTTGDNPVKPKDLSSAQLTAWPNPVKDNLTLSFNLQQPDVVKLVIFDIQGKLVATIYEGRAEAKREYRFAFNPANIVAGMYIGKLMTKNNVREVKLMVVK